ncbi:MAG: tRNA1(Val) (adenine(37)-N6)-methyltransferase [Sphingobacteriaceae bacterium]
MKINTDGVLLGAIAFANQPLRILDIGTGTGVIALMLAQRFPNSHINAVEFDTTAAETASSNFTNSPFQARLCIFPISMELFFDQNPEYKFDMIVSNPPFYLRSLESLEPKKALAKHTDIGFFLEMLTQVKNSLLVNGLFWLIVPSEIAHQIIDLAVKNGLYLQRQIKVLSFPNSKPHREICSFGLQPVTSIALAELVIYQQPKTYSMDYTALLKDFFIIF